MAAVPGQRLYWLPTARDFRRSLAELDALRMDRSFWDGAIALAQHNLDLVQTIQLDRLIRSNAGAADSRPQAARFVRLAILATSTTSHLQPGIRIGCLRRGVNVDIYEPGFGQYRHAIADLGSEFWAFRPDVVLVALDAHHVSRGHSALGDRSAAEERLNHSLNELKRLCGTIRERLPCRIILQTALPIIPALLGANEHRLPNSPRQMILSWNEALRDLAEQEGFDLITPDQYAAWQGWGCWFDPALWHKAKQEISPLVGPFYGDLVGRVLGAQSGASSKCLVLDLDNTLWGGVIGDDGPNGLVLGAGSAAGEAFCAFQRYLSNLGERGAILAVCSKNDEANATAVFEHHPEMVLRLKDIACFCANWNDKATNIRSIASTLNIGLDSIVFADDNPAEREWVRSRLPSVRVPELPADPAHFAQCLSDSGYFEAVVVTADDLGKAGQYQANEERANAASAATDMDAFLAELRMELIWGPFDDINRPRVVQLINKTNQFNLTTQRCSDQEVSAFERDPRCLGLHFRLLDRFGDNGIISVVMARADGDETLVLENWWMSCRVLGRRVERAVRAVVATEARSRGYRTIVGKFRPTERNQMVREHYRSLGFACVAEDASGATTWCFDVDSFADLPVPIDITERKTEWMSAQSTLA